MPAKSTRSQTTELFDQPEEPPKKIKKEGDSIDLEVGTIVEEFNSVADGVG